ncbi:membrane protein [Xanthomonas fragariae]|uniref:Membrane protein n=1 Tax=Xanthomonas fragariae TaxID=48664 RepID=A0A1Y6HR61_9XANT|nr:membrane protein [Xanthomonas fragariae]
MQGERCPETCRACGHSAGCRLRSWCVENDNRIDSAWRLVLLAVRVQRHGFALALQGGVIGGLLLTVFGAFKLYGLLGAGLAMGISVALIAGRSMRNWTMSPRPHNRGGWNCRASHRTRPWWVPCPGRFPIIHVDASGGHAGTAERIAESRYADDAP